MILRSKSDIKKYIAAASLDAFFSKNRDGVRFVLSEDDMLVVEPEKIHSDLIRANKDHFKKFIPKAYVSRLGDTQEFNDVFYGYGNDRKMRKLKQRCGFLYCFGGKVYVLVRMAPRGGSSLERNDKIETLICEKYFVDKLPQSKVQFVQTY